MQINFKPTAHTRYSESTQVNPIRWLCLHEVSEGVFENTTNLFKCKDYFNDFTAHWHKEKPFKIYHMPSDAAVFDAHGGLYVLICNLCEQFIDNFNRVIPTLESKFGCRVSFQKLDETQTKDVEYINNAGLLYFNADCFKSTFRMSTLTLFIRNCNVKNKLNSHLDIVKTKQFIRESMSYDYESDFWVNLDFSKLPEDTYWWYSGEKWNSQKNNSSDYGISEAIHNCGVHTWITNCIGTKDEDSDWDEEEQDEEEVDAL